VSIFWQIWQKGYRSFFLAQMWWLACHHCLLDCKMGWISGTFLVQHNAVIWHIVFAKSVRKNLKTTSQPISNFDDFFGSPRESMLKPIF
jgi:hypothetical protein